MRIVHSGRHATTVPARARLLQLIVFAAIALFWLSCAGELADNRPDRDSGPQTQAPGQHVAVNDGPPESPPVTSPPVTLSPMRALARDAQNHMINYGPWSPSEIAQAKTYDVVTLDPSDGVTRAQVAEIQGGTDPDDPSKRVIVLCYVSIGEDIRTAGMTDAEMLADPRFVGDGTGPRMDPRGPDADGTSLSGLDPLGLPSNGGTGYASWYLDDVSVRNGVDNIGDGKPDRNGNFDGAFVNAGDPRWFDALQDMQLDGVDGIAGLREILTTDYGRGLGCDGVFLDTVDTAAPNSWTDADSSNETKYEWTAPGFGEFIQRLRTAYPDVVILQNRGLFYFNPRNVQYPFIPRGNIDFLLFESYRLNSSSSASSNPDPIYYPDNRYNYAPKLMAEANRAGGFRVLSVGYAEGSPDAMSQDTLIGESTLGRDSLLEDIDVTERLAGFRHYLTNSSLTLVNLFVEMHADRSDASPPIWTSTYNDNNGTPASEASPRQGIQEVVAGPGSLLVRWDVALDLNRVRYALYYKTTPFDFASDPTLASATRVPLQARPAANYSEGARAGVYANEATVTNLVAGQEYYLVIRAFDDSPAGNEDQNQVVLSAVPGGGTPYLGNVQVSNGADSLTYRYQYAQDWKYRRVYIDRDRISGTGWAEYGIGADLLLEEGNLYRYTGDGSSWSWTFASPAKVTGGPVNNMSFVQWDLAMADVGTGYQHTNLVFQVQRTGAVNTSAIHEHVYTTTAPTAPYSNYFAHNDATRLSFHADISVPFSYKHIFIDSDASEASGYGFGGIGADYLIENGTLYRHSGGGWSWALVGSANLYIDGASHNWSVSRSDVDADGGAPLFRLVFQANGESPDFVAPVYTHAFSR